MAIVIPVQSAFDIETFDGLKAFLVTHLELDSETEAQLPSLIRMAEYHLDRMLTVPQRETFATLTTVAGIDNVDLPTDCRQIRMAQVTGDEGYPLSPVTPNALFSYAGVSGKPQVYAVINQAAYFAPTPDAAYSVRVLYLASLPALSDTNQTNWLLTENADAYVYAALIQCEAFLGHDARIPLLDAALSQTMDEVNRQGNRYRNASPMRLRSPVVV